MKIVTRELLDLADLIRAQTLCVYELLEVIMISEYKELVFATF